MPAGNDNSLESPWQIRFAVAWLLFFLAIFGLGSYKAWENRRDAAVQQDWHVRWKKLQAQAQTQFTLLREQARILLGKPNSQRQLEIDWNAGEPFELKREGARDVAVWEDPKYGCHFELKFNKGVFTGWSANWAGGLGKLYPRPAQFSRTGKAASVRRQIAKFSLYGWLVFFVAWWILAQHRCLLSQILLAAALAYGMATLVHPNYTLTWRGIFSNDNLAIAAALVAVSIVLLAAMLVAARPDARSLFPVRFGLRRLLGAMTVIACLLAVGPLGYLVLIVGIVGTGLFVAIYEITRTRLDMKRQMGVDAA
ncbi:MAG: hypothetical protein WD669_01615 [Pirellulales bacterium]